MLTFKHQELCASAIVWLGLCVLSGFKYIVISKVLKTKMHANNFYPFKIHYNNMGNTHWRERKRFYQSKSLFQLLYKIISIGLIIMSQSLHNKPYVPTVYKKYFYLLTMSYWKNRLLSNKLLFFLTTLLR